MTNNYNKPALTVDKQIDLLVSRGLNINVISPESKWTKRLHELIKDHPFINPTRMGFPSGWQNDGFWE